VERSVVPKLDIAGQKVTVGDGFLKLSAEQQGDMVDEIASSLRSSGHLPARQEGPGADIIKGIGGGLVRGAAGTAGLVTDKMPGWINQLADRATQKITGEPEEEFQKRVGERNQQYANSSIGKALSTDNIQKFIEKITGEAYQPHTPAGRAASNVAEFVPGGAIGKVPNIARNLITYGVVPGLVSEGAGQAFKGSTAEPLARTIGALGAGIGGAAIQRLGSAERLVRNAIEGVSPAQLDQMEALLKQAQQSGIPISRAEALQAVTRGATGIGDLQHSVEGMGGMKPFYAERPAQNEAAARRTFDTIAPPNHDPSQIGPAAGAAGENTVNQIRTAINAATRPMYDAAGQHLVPPAVHAAMRTDPLFVDALDAVRNNPAKNSTVMGHSDRSIAVYDAVKKELGERAQNASAPMNPNASQAISAATGGLADTVKGVAIAADKQATSGPSSYEAALANQARLRGKYLNPVLNGPIGKIAGQDTTTKAAVDALFPANPLPNSQGEIAETMRALSKQRPGVANDLVRAHAEMTFNETAQRLASGGFNQSGGAKFAAVLRGNSQQAANLEASVRALPNGDATWKGFNRLLDVMEAQQYRQATGSRTAFKTPGVEDLKSGGIVNNAAQVIGGVGIPISKKITNAIQNWNVGRNVNELASLLTSPEAARRFRQLAALPPGSVQFGALVTRLGNLALASKRSANATKDNQ
jgi:hypothetical protein